MVRYGVGKMLPAGWHCTTFGVAPVSGTPAPAASVAPGVDAQEEGALGDCSSALDEAEEQSLFDGGFDEPRVPQRVHGAAGRVVEKERGEYPQPDGNRECD